MKALFYYPENEAVPFSLTWDRNARIVIWSVCAGVCVMGPYSFWFTFTFSQSVFGYSWMTALFCAAAWFWFFMAIPGIGICFFPRTYFLDEKHVIVYRSLFPVLIPRDGIASAHRFSRPQLSARRRAGAVPCMGRFWAPIVGEFVSYATRRDNWVLLRMTDGKQFVISPDDPDAFLAALGCASNIPDEKLMHWQ